MTLAAISLPLRVVERGTEWRLYSVEWTGPDGTFSTYIYAISDEHAALVISELRAGARLVGRVEGIFNE